MPGLAPGIFFLGFGRHQTPISHCEERSYEAIQRRALRIVIASLVMTTVVVPYNPSTSLLMMSRWISEVPPKMV